MTHEDLKLILEALTKALWPGVVLYGIIVTRTGIKNVLSEFAERMKDMKTANVRSGSMSFFPRAYRDTDVKVEVLDLKKG
jgi:hypothetical protein